MFVYYGACEGRTRYELRFSASRGDAPRYSVGQPEGCKCAAAARRSGRRGERAMLAHRRPSAVAALRPPHCRLNISCEQPQPNATAAPRFPCQAPQAAPTCDRAATLAPATELQPAGHAPANRTRQLAPHTRPAGDPCCSSSAAAGCALRHSSSGGLQLAGALASAVGHVLPQPDPGVHAAPLHNTHCGWRQGPLRVPALQGRLRARAVVQPAEHHPVQ